MSDEEKFFKSISTLISRQYHIRPIEIETNWTLPEITQILASFYEESKENEKMQKEFEQAMNYSQ